MIRMVALKAGWTLFFAVGFGFFLPWIRTQPVDSNRDARREQVVNQLASEANQSWLQRWLGMRNQDYRLAIDQPFDGESGFDIIRRVRSQEPTAQQNALYLAQVYGFDNALYVALFIYAPLALAVITLAFFKLGFFGPHFFMALATADLGFYAFARYRLASSFLDRMVNGVVPGSGLWISLYGLAGIGLLAALAVVIPFGKR